MHIFRKFVLIPVVATLWSFAPVPSHATWLGLEDGTYDVTLSCVFSSVISCPATLHAALSINGIGADFMDVTINGEHFSGDPNDLDQTTATVDNQLSQLQVAPFSFFSLIMDQTIPNPVGLTDHWWGYCRTATATSCFPDTDGNWTAARVPEPATLGLLGLGLAGLGVMRRRRAA